MKVLHVISTLETGGAQRLLVDMLPIMGKREEMTVLVNLSEETPFLMALQEAGVKVKSLNYRRLYSPLNICKIRRHLKKYDMIHVHLFPSLYWVAFANLFLGKKLIYTEHSTYNSRRSKQWLRPLEKYVYSRYTKILSISDLTQSNLKQWLKVVDNDRRFEIVNNGVDLSHFHSKNKTRNGSKVLIMVSRFAESKDQATVIRSMALLDKHIRLVLVGDGPTIEQCKTLAKELNVADRVDFVGMQSNVSRWLEKADIGIQSSKWEGFGLTAVEMMAAGLPVIATSVDGLKQVVEGAGELFNVGDEKELVNKVNRLVSDVNYYETVSGRCMERATIYDIKTTAQKYLNIYKEIFEDDR